MKIESVMCKVEKTYLFYAVTPEEMGDRDLYPTQRMTEISRCKSDKAQREKYWVWILLEKALKEALNIDIANLKFTKLPSGKWVSDSAYFSLSHTDGAMTVAVSHTPVGVDIEGINELRSGIEAKILTDAEMAEYRTVSAQRRSEFLIEKWCAKEAIFKAGDKTALLPKTIETSDYTTETRRISLGGKEYIVALYAEEGEEIRNSELGIRN